MQQRSTCTGDEYGNGNGLLRAKAYHHILCCGHVWLPTKLVPLYVLMIRLLTKVVLQQDEFWLCTGLWYLQIQPNASKLTGQHFTVLMDSEPKYTSKATQEFIFSRPRRRKFCNDLNKQKITITLSVSKYLWNFILMVILVFTLNQTSNFAPRHSLTGCSALTWTLLLWCPFPKQLNQKEELNMDHFKRPKCSTCEGILSRLPHV